MWLRGGKISITIKAFTLLTFISIIFLMVGSVSAVDANLSNLNTTQDVSNNLEINYNVDYLNNEVQTTNSIEKTNLSADDIEMYYHNGTRYVAKLVDKDNNPINGRNISININGVDYYRLTNDTGHVSIDLNLNKGNYTIFSKFAGDANYASSNCSSSLTILPTIVGDDIVKFFKNGTNYQVKCCDNIGKALTNSYVIFNINGVLYNRTTDDKGIATLNINLCPGNYIITAKNTFNNDSISNHIKVTSVYASNLTKFYKNNTQFLATFAYSGGYLQNTDVYFDICGKTYSRITNESGVAIININLEPGNYNITTTNPSTGESINNTITVLSTVVSDNLIKYYKNESQFVVKVLDGQGNVLSNSEVIFNINGVLYARITDNNGFASLNINLQPDTYIITTTTKNGECKSNNITVLSTIVSNDLVKYYRNSSQFTVKILDGTGKVLNNVEVTFNINGVLYTRNTNQNGIATLNINLKPSIYEITSSYNGLEIGNWVNVIVAETNLTTNNHYMYYTNKSAFKATLTYANGEVIKNRPVTFTINNVSYKRYTDNEGIALLNINLGIGEYYILTEFNEEFFEKCSNLNHVDIVDSQTILMADDVTLEYKYGAYNVTVLNSITREPIVNKNVTFIINGKSYNKTTNLNGVASININLDPGLYNITYSYSSKGELDYATGSRLILVTKYNVLINTTDLIKYKGGNEPFVAHITDKNKNPLTNLSVDFTINGVIYTKKTDKEGFVSLNINLGTGLYEITTEINDFYYAGQSTNNVLINGTYYFSNDCSYDYGTVGYFPVQILDVFLKPVSGIDVTFSIDSGSNIQTVVTDELGFAKAIIQNYDVGSHQIVFYYTDFNGEIVYVENTFNIIPPIKVQDVIDSSIIVRNYINSNYELPNSINVGSYVVNPATFMYLLSKSLIKITNGDFGSVDYITVLEPTNPLEVQNLGNLENYLPLAYNYISYTDAYGISPDSITSDLGEVGYEGAIYALSRVIAYYGENDALPAYVTIKTLKPTFDGPLNDLNTIEDLTPYLVSTKNCNIYAENIQSLAEQLTSGLTSDYEKASAVYNYVRDSISYSFYYDTHYGASGTLDRGTGNCCDQAHLVVALARASGLPARYKHGTCTFSDGTFGHVWAQILVGDTWVVSDPTSSRNLFGVVNNWNNYNYELHATYSELPF